MIVVVAIESTVAEILQKGNRHAMPLEVKAEKSAYVDLLVLTSAALLLSSRPIRLLVHADLVM